MKRIAVSTVKRFLNDSTADVIITRSFQIEDNQFEVQIKTKLNLDERSVFVNRVVNGCFNDNGRFLPEYYLPLIHTTLIQMCTNIPPLTMKGEKAENGEAIIDIDAMDRLFYALHLDKTDDENFQNTYREMQELCSDAIEWDAQHRFSLESNGDIKSAASAIRSLAQELLEKVTQIDSKDLMEYAATLSEKTSKLDKDSIAEGLFKAYDEGKMS